MVRAEGVQTHHERPDDVARRVQVANDLIGCGSANASDVLSKHPTGSELSHQACEVGPQMTFVFRALPFAGDAVRLTGKSTAEHVDGLHGVPANRSDVSEIRDAGPVLSQHGSGVGIDLGLPHDGHAGAFEPEIESANT